GLVHLYLFRIFHLAHSVCRYASRSSSSCWLITFPCAGIMFLPRKIVAETRSSFAAAPLGRYGFLNTPSIGGPFSFWSVRSLWQITQSAWYTASPSTSRASSWFSGFGGAPDLHPARIPAIPSNKTLYIFTLLFSHLA